MAVDWDQWFAQINDAVGQHEDFCLSEFGDPAYCNCMRAFRVKALRDWAEAARPIKDKGLTPQEELAAVQQVDQAKGRPSFWRRLKVLR